MHINAHLDVDLVAVETAETVSLLLELTAPEVVVDQAVARPEHTAIVVLDCSGSMGGRRIQIAKRAILDLVERLDERDRFGLVVFAGDVQVVVPAGQVRDLGRAGIAEAVGSIVTGGRTNLSGGYLRGLQEAERACGQAGATVILLSDGHANAGITDEEQLQQVAAKAAAGVVTSSTIGLGGGYDERLLSAIALGGSGNHSFAETEDDGAAALAGEVEGLLSKSVQAASLLIAPTADVTRITVVNNLVSHAVDEGVMVELGDFYSSEERRVLIELLVPAMAGLGLSQVAELSLKYVELPALEQHTVTLPVSVNVVPADVAAGRVPSPVVQREQLFLSAQRVKKETEDALRSGDVERARKALDDAGRMLQGAPPELQDDVVAAEVEWLATTKERLDSRARAYSLKRLRSDHHRKSRGYKSRTQGGEVSREDGSEPPF